MGERLRGEINLFEEAVALDKGFSESKRLFMITKKTDAELSAAIKKYYRMMGIKA